MHTLIPSRVARSATGNGPTSSASLYSCWASSPAEVRAAQSLRQRVFFDEMGARVTNESGAAGELDVDRFDEFCDHLLIKSRGPNEPEDDEVVGTYRVLSPESARQAGGYYTETEFDMRSWHSQRQGMAELGRSCVHPEWRRGAVIMMLWTALGAYMQHRGLSTLVGCCSVPLWDDGATARALWTDLSRSHLVEEASRVYPRKPFDVAPTGRGRSDSDAQLPVPALMKGYLRCGATLLGAPAYDAAFDTADFPMMLRLADLTPAYRQHFMGSAS